MPVSSGIRPRQAFSEDGPTGRDDRVERALAVDGRGTTAVTARALREVGWGGERIRVRVAAHPAMTRLKAGEPMAGVAIDGMSGTSTSTSALARSSVGEPSFGWRLRHLF